MTFETSPESGAGKRQFLKVTPSTGSGTTSDIDKHLTSLVDLEQQIESEGKFGRFLNKLSTPYEPIRFEFIAYSAGEDEAVELYYSATGKLQTLKKRLKSIYPSSFNIEEVDVDLGVQLVKPIKMTEAEFRERFLNGELYHDRERYVSYTGEPGDDGSTEGYSEDRKPLEEKSGQHSSEPIVRGSGDDDDDDVEDDDDSEDGGGDESSDTDSSTGSDEADGENEPSETDSSTDSEQAAATSDEAQATPATSDADGASETDEANASASAQGPPEASDETGLSEPSSDPADLDEQSDDSYRTDGGVSTSSTDSDAHTPITQDRAEVLTGGAVAGFNETLVFDDTGEVIPLKGPNTIPDEGPLVTVDWPTRTSDGHILARPPLEETKPNAVKWYGKEDTPGDWMTTLDTATESNPEYESGSEDEDIEAPDTLQTLFSHLEEAPQPTAYQVVFEAKRPWDHEATEHKKRIRSGQLNQPILERIFGNPDDDVDRDLKAYEYRRIKLIENKRPRKTFHTNIRAVSLTPAGEGVEEGPSTQHAQQDIDESLNNMVPLLDPLDGVYYSIQGSRAPDEPGFFKNEYIADEVVTHFFERELRKIEDDRHPVGIIDPWDNRRKHPEIIVNGRELGELIVIPSGEDMDNDVFRSTGTKSKEIEPLRRPRPEIHKEFKSGLSLGYAYNENGIPEATPTCLPEHKLTNHWAMFGASGSGKTVNTIGMLLSAYADTEGPTIVIDPKQGNMIENYMKAHYARFGNLRDVYVFSVPETLPAIPFFDIRPYLYEGVNRDDAIQQKVDEFHLIMEMIDENYSTAYVAKTVLGALIKSQFDLRHGRDNYTLDDLYDAAMSLYVEKDVPRVSHQPQVARIFQNQVNKGDQEFKNTMQAVVNRLDDLQEDINLYRLFNQNPEWDDEKGTYVTNRYSRNGDDEEEGEDGEGSEEGTDGDAVHDAADGDEEADGETGENGESGGENEENSDEEDEQNKEPKSALDFRQFLEDDCIILFDTGNLVRDESQQAFSMYILSSLWGSIRSRYNNLESHEEIPGTTKIVIEESAPIVSTELVTNTLIPEAREFGLSLGMIMQYPSQVMTSGVDGSFNELKNNVETKIYGHIDPKRDIADSLVHDEQDTTAIKNKIRRLGGGEWIVDLPAPTFDVEVPPPFSLTSLDIPDGHPAGDNPLNDGQRNSLNRQVNQRRDHTRNHYGIERLSAEELAAQNSVGTKERYSDTTESDPEDSVVESRTAQQSGDQGSSDDDAGSVEAEGSPFVASDKEGEFTRGADEVVAQSTSSDSQSEGSGGRSETDTGSARAPAQDERDPAGETSGGSSASDTTSEPRVSPPDGSNTPNALEMGDSDEDVETTAADSDPTHAPENTDDVEEVPDGPQPEHSEQDTDQVDKNDEAGDESDDAADGESTTADEDTPDDSGGIEGLGSELLSDEDVPDDLNQEALEAVGAVGSDTEKPGEETADTSNTHPTDVELDTPFHESYSTLSIEEREEANLSEDDEKFMALIADAFCGNLPDYTLGESMTGLKNRAGSPDVDHLKDLGYIDDDNVLRRKHYSLTRSGWRIINDSVPGNEFGDHMEKIKHRVGVHLLAEQMEDDFSRVETYATYQGETYDLIAYDTNREIARVGEVETASNNKEALIEDYEKLAAAPGESVWVFPSNPTGEKLWGILEEEVLEHDYSTHTKQVASRLDEELSVNPEEGADKVRNYEGLLSDD